MEIREINQEEVNVCWDCGMIIESYVYSYTIYLKNGKEIVVEDIVGEEDLERIEDEAKEEYGSEFDSIGFGEFCPHCLACM